MLSLLLLVSSLPSTVQNDYMVLCRVCPRFLGNKCVILLTMCVFVQNQSQFMHSLVSLTWTCLSAPLMHLYPALLMMIASSGKCLRCSHPNHHTVWVLICIVVCMSSAYIIHFEWTFFLFRLAYVPYIWNIVWIKAEILVILCFGFVVTPHSAFFNSLLCFVSLRIIVFKSTICWPFRLILPVSLCSPAGRVWSWSSSRRERVSVCG